MMPKRILVRIPNWLGDAVMSLPTLKALRRLYPQSHLAVLVKSGLAELFRFEPAVDEALVYDPHGQGVGKIKAELALAREIRGKKFDVLLILPRSFHSALQGFLGKIPHRVGYAAEGRSALLTTALPRAKDLLTSHRVHYFLNLLTPLAGGAVAESRLFRDGKEITVTKPQITIPADIQQWAREQLHSVVGGDPTGKGQYLVGVNPSATYGPAKCWPVERYIELVKRLLEKDNVKVVLVGGRGPARTDGRSGGEEEKLSGRIVGGSLKNELLPPIVGCNFTGSRTINTLKHHPRIMDFTGKTTVMQLAGLLKCCDVLVTNDTGPMHVGAAVGTPIVALFGSTDPVTTAPFAEKDRYTIIRKEVSCSPCLKRVCPTDHRCMNLITVDEVLTAVFKIIQSSN